MLINLTNINREAVILDNKIEFDESYFQNSPISGMKSCYVTGKVYDDFGEIVASGFVSGVMILKDTVTLELIEHPYSFDFEEIISQKSEYFQKNQNTLDIKGILWQNIVLEVPMRLTKVASDINLKGEGWELKNDDEKQINPQLSKLTELMEEEEGESKNGSSI